MTSTPRVGRGTDWAVGAAAVLLLLSIAARTASAQGVIPREVMSSSPRVSSSVLATWYTSRDEEGARLDLIVLWRGEVGWHGGEGVEVTGSDGFCPETGARCPGVASDRYRVGGVALEVTLDRLGQTANVLDEEIRLRETNAVLVDRVDGVGGPPTVVGRLWLPVTLSSLRLDVAALVMDDERLSAFVR